MKNLNRYTADFETTTDKNDCRVWGYGICSIENPNMFLYGNSIEDFFKTIKNIGGVYYFHNLKFDGEFIIIYLLKNGFKHTKNKKIEIGEFTTLISDIGVWYNIKVNYDGVQLTFVDSLKILNFSVEKIAKGFNLPLKKLEIDYNKKRGLNYKLTKKEIEYIKNDVKIMSLALKIMFDNELTKNTIASNALNNFKKDYKKDFKKIFPIIEDEYFRHGAYKGGYVYVNKKYQNKKIKTGIVFDVNSLYPYVMHEKFLPYGQPIYFKGKPKKDKIYNLFIINIRCSFKIKKGYVPTIQIKNRYGFNSVEYLEKVEDDIILQLTNIDLEIFLKHYNVYNLEYIDGYKFKSTNKIFKKYIDKWVEVKEKATIEKNEAMRTIAKLLLNSLYGKFGKNPKQYKKIPYLENDVLKFTKSQLEEVEPIYIPVACFITAHARKHIINFAQQNYNRFIYADTDSLHLLIDLPDSIKSLNCQDIKKVNVDELVKLGVDIPNIPIDNVKLGYFKMENIFNKARFIRAKTYIECWDEDLKITCAGMPKACYKYVTFDNFVEGATFEGKLVPKHVKNGVVLEETTFTIKI